MTSRVDDRLPGAPAVAVFGAAGKTGLAVTRALAVLNVSVLGLIRRSEQVPSVMAAGAAATVIVDLADSAAVADAVSGVDAVYLLAPNVHPDEPGLLGRIIERLTCRVVYHSVMHPYAPAMPHHLDKAKIEATLHESVRDWTVLQPASYMENAFAVADSVVARGEWPVPYSPVAAFTPVALSDVAEAAARVLTEDGHSNATYELAGPQVLTTEQMAATWGAALGREVRCVPGRLGWEEQAVGLPAEAGRRLRAMFNFYDKYGFCGGSEVLRHLLGREPVTWADVVGRMGSG